MAKLMIAFDSLVIKGHKTALHAWLICHVQSIEHSIPQAFPERHGHASARTNDFTHQTTAQHPGIAGRVWARSLRDRPLGGDWPSRVSRISNHACISKAMYSPSTRPMYRDRA